MENWSPQERLLIDHATELASILRGSLAANWCASGESARHYLKLAAERGLTGIEVPQAWGGSQASFSCKAAIAEILAGADFGFAMSLINTHNVANNIARWMSGPGTTVGQAELADELLPKLLSTEIVACTALTEPQAGSDFSAISTLATKVDSGWKIDGEKSWIINAQFADLILVYAQTLPQSGAAGIAGILVDARREGFERCDNFPSTAAASLGTGSFKLNGYVATPVEMMHPAGTAFKRALQSINGARIYVAAMCCGMVADCLRIATDYGGRRTTFGVPLNEHQGWRWRIAEAAVDLEAATQLVRAACKAMDRDLPVVALAAKAKVFATRMAERHTAAMLHAMGAHGLRDEYPFVRHRTGAQIASFTDGSTEMMLERIFKDETLVR